MSGYGREGAWSWWFLALWGSAAVGLAAAYFVVSTMTWSALAASAFGVLETIGLLRAGDGKPPLTFAIRRYVPRWFAFPAIYFLAGSQVVRAALAGELLVAAALIGFLGWLTSHFDVTYTETRKKGWPPKRPAAWTGD